MLRLHAAEWHIDPHKIGVLGFSAGGYLVADISTHFAHRVYDPVDAADKVKAVVRILRLVFIRAICGWRENSH